MRSIVQIPPSEHRYTGACRWGCTTTIHLLVGRNVDKEARTKRGGRPVDVAKYHYAMLQNPEEVIEELVKPSPQEGDEEITSQFPSLAAELTAGDEVEKFPVLQENVVKSTTDDGDSRYFSDSCNCVSSLPSHRLYCLASYLECHQNGLVKITILGDQ